MHNSEPRSFFNMTTDLTFSFLFSSNFTWAHHTVQGSFEGSFIEILRQYGMTVGIDVSDRPHVLQCTFHVETVERNLFRKTFSDQVLGYFFTGCAVVHFEPRTIFGIHQFHQSGGRIFVVFPCNVYQKTDLFCGKPLTRIFAQKVSDVFPPIFFKFSRDRRNNGASVPCLYIRTEQRLIQSDETPGLREI